MEDVRTTYAAQADAREEVDAGTLLGQVMFLVAIAIGFTVVGTVIGRDLSQGTATICFLAGAGMLLVQNFVRALRVGTFAIVWLYAVALLIGLGLGPALAYIVETQPAALTQAIAGTAVVVAGMGTAGFVMGKDLARWMRPLSIAVFAAVGLSYVLFIFSSGANPILSLVIGGLSALLILVDFNYLRKHGTRQDAVWLATGIFVSIINIFLALLQLFSD